MDKQIGWYHLKEDKVFHDNGYECAAWYENIAVKAGSYPIMVYDYKVKHFDDEARKEFNGRIGGHIDSAYAVFNGTITDDYFGSMFCGVAVGTYDEKQNAGKPAHYSMHMYLYSLAEHVYKGEEEYELFPEYKVKEDRFISSFDNRECVLYHIYEA